MARPTDTGADEEDAEDQATLRLYFLEQRAGAQAAYQETPDDFYCAWRYLATHPIFEERSGHSLFERELYIHPAKVNPETREIDPDESKNTHLEIWLEHGPLYRKDDAPPWFWTQDLEEHHPCDYIHTHDPDLDTGGDTFEQAIIALARLVRQEYGDDRSRVYVCDEERHPEKDTEEQGT